MNLEAMGNIGSYVKNKQLAAKWLERKKDPFKAKEGEDPKIAEYRRQLAEIRKSNQLYSINAKMKSGQKLTSGEMEYLRENAPDEYEKAVKLEKEREEYRRELENCRSREDVEQLKFRKVNTLLGEAKAVMANPNIPLAKKEELVEYIGMRLFTALDEEKTFKQTPEYARLPEETREEDKVPVEIISDEERELEINERITVEADPLAKLEDFLAALGETKPEAASEQSTGTQPTGIYAPGHSAQPTKMHTSGRAAQPTGTGGYTRTGKPVTFTPKSGAIAEG